jgi:hypothetical protein
MANFNLGAGLSLLGETVGKFAGMAALEQQRAALQRDSLVLADQLASERESRGRKEAHGYAIETLDKQQTYDAAKTDKTIAADLQRAGIAAGASKYSADASVRAAQMQIDAMAPVRQAQVEASNAAAAGAKLDNDLKAAQSAARKELEAATTSGDETAIKAARDKVAIYDESAALRAQQARGLAVETDAKALKLKGDQLIQDAKDDILNAGNDQAKAAYARRRLRILESSTKEERQEIALWQQQAKLAEAAMTATMTRLTTLQGQGMLTPESKALEDTLQKVLQQQRREFAAAAARAAALLDSLDPATKAKPGADTGAVNPADFLRTSKAPPKAPSKPFPGGLIDDPTPWNMNLGAP